MDPRKLPAKAADTARRFNRRRPTAWEVVRATVAVALDLESPRRKDDPPPATPRSAARDTARFKRPGPHL